MLTSKSSTEANKLDNQSNAGIRESSDNRQLSACFGSCIYISLKLIGS